MDFTLKPTSPPMDAAYERDLLQRCLTEPDAFREVYRHYYPRLYAYIVYRVGGKHDAEDLTADVFMQVVKALPKFEHRGEGAFSAWLFRIAYNRVAQFYAYSRRVDAPLSLDDVPEISLGMGGFGDNDSPTPETTVACREQFARLHAMIATLTPRRQEVVTLRYFGGLNNREIAAVLGLDEGTIAAHLSRALDDLARKLRE